MRGTHVYLDEANSLIGQRSENNKEEDNKNTLILFTVYMC